MAPGEHELLVHVTASSTARDDKRYVDIARAVLDFRPAIVTRVSGSEPLPPPSPYSEYNIKEDDGSVMIRGWRPARLNLPRPRTAPELTSIADSINVSTVGAEHRRAHSETICICNSFLTPNKASVEGKSCTDLSLLSSPFRPHRSPSGRAVFVASSSQKSKKLRTKGADSGYMHPVRSGSLEQHKRTAPCSLKSHESAPPACVVSAADDAESTQSASPSRMLNHGGPMKKHNEFQKSPVPFVIDLTTPERRASSSYPTPTSSPVHFNQFPSSTTCEATRTETPTSCHCRATQVDAPAPRPPVSTRATTPPFGNRIRQRPDEVRPLPEFLPQRSQANFTTHITNDLEKFTSQMYHFRPACVARDVRVLERGYWQFWVRLAEKSPQATLKLLGSTARRKRDAADTRRPKPALWTGDQFVRAWENVAKTIELGKVGWGTWVVKESTDDSLWRIRVFTWGETIAHIWLMLFWQSNKLTGMMSMDWIAADGQVVVQMTPGQNLRGCWERKGTDGVQGVWGFTQGRK